MKRFFVAALALLAIVGCKENKQSTKTTEQTATVEQRDSVVVEPDVVRIDEAAETEPQEVQ